MGEYEPANEANLPTLQQAITHTKAFAETRWRSLPHEKIAEDTLYSGAMQKDPYALLAVAILRRNDLGDGMKTLKKLVEANEKLAGPLQEVQGVYELWSRYVEVLGLNLANSDNIGDTPNNENN